MKINRNICEGLLRGIVMVLLLGGTAISLMALSSIKSQLKAKQKWISPTAIAWDGCFTPPPGWTPGGGWYPSGKRAPRQRNPNTPPVPSQPNPNNAPLPTSTWPTSTAGTVRPNSGPGIAPYMWDQLFNDPNLTFSVFPMWESWWMRNRLYYLSFREPITWIDRTTTGETIPVSKELQKRASDLLTECIKENKNSVARAYAALALGKLRDKNALPVLQELFKNDKDLDVRDVTSLSIGILEDESSVNTLKTLTAGQKDSYEKTLGECYVALSLGYIKTDASIETLKGILNANNIDKEIQCSALLGLGNIQEKLLVPFISKLLNDTSRDKYVRSYAALALGRIKDPSALPELRKALTEKDKDIRSSAIIAMGLIKSTDAKDDLVKILNNDRVPEVRGYAAIALAQLGDKSVYPIISKISKKGDYNVQGMSILALGILGNEEALPELRKLIEKKGNPATYSAAIMALGLLKDKNSVSTLIKIVEKEEFDPISWPYAIQSLGMIGDPQAVPTLEKAFKKAQEKPDLAINAYNNLTIALSMLGKRNEALSVLYEQLNNKSLIPDFKWRILYGIGYIGDKNSIEPLIKFYNDQKDDILRIYTVFALGCILDKDKINPLYKITADTNFSIWLHIINDIFIVRPD